MKNLLILNWRDPLNPNSGGAEKLNLRIIEGFQEKGFNVTWYSTAVKGLPAGEQYKGIKIIRAGNMFTHFLYFPYFVLARKFGNIDIVIDGIHGIGYLSPIFFPRTKRIILICEVAKNIWDEMFDFPLNKIGKCLEPLMFFIYRREIFWTISDSTKQDLLKMGISGRSIIILPMGFDAIDVGKQKRYEEPTALFVGRLAEVKGVKDAIKAIHIARKSDKKWKLLVIGRGSKEYYDELRSIVRQFKLEKSVKFLGYVSERRKFVEMKKSWILLVPSSREGWGMIIPEANYSGTAALSYKSPGIIDSAVYSKKNILVDPSPKKIADFLVKVDRPVEVSKKIEAGWSELNNFIAKYTTD